MKNKSQRSHSVSLCIPHFSRNRRAQSAGIDNEPWFGIWYSIIAGEVSPLKSKRPGSVPLKGEHDMSKTKEELDALKEEVESVNEKLAELTPEEIAQVNGGQLEPPVLTITRRNP